MSNAFENVINSMNLKKDKIHEDTVPNKDASIITQWIHEIRWEYIVTITNHENQQTQYTITNRNKLWINIDVKSLYIYDADNNPVVTLNPLVDQYPNHAINIMNWWKRDRIVINREWLYIPWWSDKQEVPQDILSNISKIIQEASELQKSVEGKKWQTIKSAKISTFRAFNEELLGQ